MKKYFLIILILILGFAINYFQNNKSLPSAQTGVLKVTPPAQTAQSSSQSAVLGLQTKTSGCEAINGLQDKNCTPGSIFAQVTKSQVCVKGYSSSVRNVPVSEKDAVYKEYGIYSHKTGEYEVDHLISLELGGSNDIANLWPEAALPVPGFHEKDLVENYLHSRVCSGVISLQEAQKEISTDWLSVYNSMPKQ